jgi:hypothetical protein
MNRDWSEKRGQVCSVMKHAEMALAIEVAIYQDFMEVVLY